jgi:dihydroorotate dehydrogenase (NAD+) catalytic subunit
MTLDIKKRRPSLGTMMGGLSGPAIKPIALYMVYKVAGVAKVPIIGCGGISCAEDALEFIMAGASAVQVGTATLSKPQAALDVLEGIKQFAEREGIGNLRDIVGIARVQ